MDKVLFVIGLIFIASAFMIFYASVKFEKELIREEIIPRYEKSKIIFSNITYIIRAKYKLINKYKIAMNDYVYITIPRNTTYQYSILVSMNPKYVKLQKDNDGNVFAVLLIRLEPGKSKWIEATFKVRVSGYKILFNRNESTWPDYEMVKKFTRKTHFWNTENNELINLAYEIKSGNTPLEIALSVAKWVRRHVSYRIQGYRLGSDRALVRTILGYVIQGDCTEVADVYVTLVRILGIPARTVFGFLLTEHKTKMWINLTTARNEGEALLKHWGGHMWSQVYLPPWGWIDVELLEEPRAKVGDYSNFHIIFGIEETKYYGTTLSNMCSSGYLDLEYIEIKVEPIKD